MKDNINKINYFKTSIIGFNSFHPIVLNNTAFIYNVGKHWVLISNFIPKQQYDSSVWYVCDSMYKTRRSVYEKLFKKILPHQDNVIIKFVNVQQQRGYDDCGLFALAYFISLFNDEDPSDKLYIQDEMRQHYNNCNTNENIIDFKQRNKKTASSRNFSSKIKNTLHLFLK